MDSPIANAHNVRVGIIGVDDSVAISPVALVTPGLFINSPVVVGILKMKRAPGRCRFNGGDETIGKRDWVRANGIVAGVDAFSARFPEVRVF
jgi:hypothetical protein